MSSGYDDSRMQSLYEQPHPMETVGGLQEYIEKLWDNCHITFYPSKNGYPIEHNPVAKKDGRGFIEAELNEL